MDVFFVRHGQTDGNIAQRYQHPDTRLNEVGKAQAEAIAGKIATLEPTHIITSTQLRAVILVRHQPKNAETLLAAFAPDTRETITALAGAKTSPINSHLLLRFLTATQEVTFSPLPHLPLEIAIIDVTTKA